MTFVGFDLHKRYITACALDASGTVVNEIRQLARCDQSLNRRVHAPMPHQQPGPRAAAGDITESAAPLDAFGMPAAARSCI
jgi:hypothetical protein